MARNAIESEFRTSKMGAGGHFVKKSQNKLELRIDLKWPEMPSKVSFGHPKWPPTAILEKNCGIDLKWQEVIIGHPKWLPAAIF